jgi:hypothetical protein
VVAISLLPGRPLVASIEAVRAKHDALRARGLFVIALIDLRGAIEEGILPERSCAVAAAIQASLDGAIARSDEEYGRLERRLAALGLGREVADLAIRAGSP